LEKFSNLKILNKFKTLSSSRSKRVFRA